MYFAVLFFILNISELFTFPVVLVHFCFASWTIYYNLTDLIALFMSLAILHIVILKSFVGLLCYLHVNCADIVHAGLVVWLFPYEF